MEQLLPSEIARLVYGYLEDSGCEQTAQRFLEESPDLAECLSLHREGKRFKTKVDGYSLNRLLDEYSEARNLVSERLQKFPESNVENLRRSGTLLAQLKFLIDATKPGDTLLLSITVPPQGSSGQISSSNVGSVVSNRPRPRILSSAERVKRSTVRLQDTNQLQPKESDEQTAGCSGSVLPVEATPLQSLPGLTQDADDHSQSDDQNKSASNSHEECHQTSDQNTSSLNQRPHDKGKSEKHPQPSCSRTSFVIEDQNHSFDVGLLSPTSTPKRKPISTAKRKNTSTPSKLHNKSRRSQSEENDSCDNLDFPSIVQAILDNKMHERIAEITNRVISTPGHVDLQDCVTSSLPSMSEMTVGVNHYESNAVAIVPTPSIAACDSELNQVIKTIVDQTEQDPLFERLLQDLIAPAEEEMTPSPAEIQSEVELSGESSPKETEDEIAPELPATRVEKKSETNVSAAEKTNTKDHSPPQAKEDVVEENNEVPLKQRLRSARQRKSDGTTANPVTPMHKDKKSSLEDQNAAAIQSIVDAKLTHQSQSLPPKSVSGVSLVTKSTNYSNSSPAKLDPPSVRHQESACSFKKGESPQTAPTSFNERNEVCRDLTADSDVIILDNVSYLDSSTINSIMMDRSSQTTNAASASQIVTIMIPGASQTSMLQPHSSASVVSTLNSILSAPLQEQSVSKVFMCGTDGLLPEYVSLPAQETIMPTASTSTLISSSSANRFVPIVPKGADIMLLNQQTIDVCYQWPPVETSSLFNPSLCTFSPTVWSTPLQVSSETCQPIVVHPYDPSNNLANPKPGPSGLLKKCKSKLLSAAKTKEVVGIRTRSQDKNKVITLYAGDGSGHVVEMSAAEQPSSALSLPKLLESPQTKGSAVNGVTSSEEPGRENLLGALNLKEAQSKQNSRGKPETSTGNKKSIPSDESGNVEKCPSSPHLTSLVNLGKNNILASSRHKESPQDSGVNTKKPESKGKLPQKPRETPKCTGSQSRAGAHSKRMSLSTPRRRPNYVRFLEFKTPPKSDLPVHRKSNTCPKALANQKLSPKTSEKLNKSTAGVRSSLFQSPDPESKVIAAAPQNKVPPIATRSPAPQLTGDWDKVTGVGLIFGDVSPDPQDLNSSVGEDENEPITPEDQNEITMAEEAQGGTDTTDGNALDSAEQPKSGESTKPVEKPIVIPKFFGTNSSKIWDADLRALVAADFDDGLLDRGGPSRKKAAKRKGLRAARTKKRTTKVTKDEARRIEESLNEEVLHDKASNVSDTVPSSLAARTRKRRTKLTKNEAKRIEQSLNDEVRHDEDSKVSDTVPSSLAARTRKRKTKVTTKDEVKQIEESLNEEMLHDKASNVSDTVPSSSAARTRKRTAKVTEDELKRIEESLNEEELRDKASNVSDTVVSSSSDPNPVLINKENTVEQTKNLDSGNKDSQEHILEECNEETLEPRSVKENKHSADNSSCDLEIVSSKEDEQSKNNEENENGSEGNILLDDSDNSSDAASITSPNTSIGSSINLASSSKVIQSPTKLKAARRTLVRHDLEENLVTVVICSDGNEGKTVAPRDQEVATEAPAKETSSSEGKVLESLHEEISIHLTDIDKNEHISVQHSTETNIKESSRTIVIGESKLEKTSTQIEYSESVKIKSVAPVLDTPRKDDADSSSPWKSALFSLPMTPRVISPNPNDTPLPKVVPGSGTLMTMTGIETPSFPPTPQIALTPQSNDSAEFVQGNYPTCSSYYKPSSEHDSSTSDRPLEQVLIEECHKLEKERSVKITEKETNKQTKETSQSGKGDEEIVTDEAPRDKADCVSEEADDHLHPQECVEPRAKEAEQSLSPGKVTSEKSKLEEFEEPSCLSTEKRKNKNSGGKRGEESGTSCSSSEKLKKIKKSVKRKRGLKTKMKKIELSAKRRRKTKLDLAFNASDSEEEEVEALVQNKSQKKLNKKSLDDLIKSHLEVARFELFGNHSPSDDSDFASSDLSDVDAKNLVFNVGHVSVFQNIYSDDSSTNQNPAIEQEKNAGTELGIAQKKTVRFNDIPQEYVDLTIELEEKRRRTLERLKNPKPQKKVRRKMDETIQKKSQRQRRSSGTQKPKLQSLTSDSQKEGPSTDTSHPVNDDETSETNQEKCQKQRRPSELQKPKLQSDSQKEGPFTDTSHPVNNDETSETDQEKRHRQRRPSGLQKPKLQPDTSDSQKVGPLTDTLHPVNDDETSETNQEKHQGQRRPSELQKPKLQSDSTNQEKRQMQRRPSGLQKPKLQSDTSDSQKEGPSTDTLHPVNDDETSETNQEKCQRQRRPSGLQKPKLQPDISDSQKEGPSTDTLHSVNDDETSETNQEKHQGQRRPSGLQKPKLQSDSTNQEKRQRQRRPSGLQKPKLQSGTSDSQKEGPATDTSHPVKDETSVTNQEKCQRQRRPSRLQKSKLQPVISDLQKEEPSTDTSHPVNDDQSKSILLPEVKLPVLATTPKKPITSTMKRNPHLSVEAIAERLTREKTATPLRPIQAQKCVHPRCEDSSSEEFGSLRLSSDDEDTQPEAPDLLQVEAKMAELHGGKGMDSIATPIPLADVRKALEMTPVDSPTKLENKALDSYLSGMESEHRNINMEKKESTPKLSAEVKPINNRKRHRSAEVEKKTNKKLKVLLGDDTSPIKLSPEGKPILPRVNTNILEGLLMSPVRPTLYQGKTKKLPLSSKKNPVKKSPVKSNSQKKSPNRNLRVKRRGRKNEQIAVKEISSKASDKRNAEATEGLMQADCDYTTEPVLIRKQLDINEFYIEIIYPDDGPKGNNFAFGDISRYTMAIDVDDDTDGNPQTVTCTTSSFQHLHVNLPHLIEYENENEGFRTQPKEKEINPSKLDSEHYKNPSPHERQLSQNHGSSFEKCSSFEIRGFNENPVQVPSEKEVSAHRSMRLPLPTHMEGHSMSSAGYRIVDRRQQSPSPSVRRKCDRRYSEWRRSPSPVPRLHRSSENSRRSQSLDRFETSSPGHRRRCQETCKDSKQKSPLDQLYKEFERDEKRFVRTEVQSRLLEMAHMKDSARKREKRPSRDSSQEMSDDTHEHSSSGRRSRQDNFRDLPCGKKYPKNVSGSKRNVEPLEVNKLKDSSERNLPFEIMIHSRKKPNSNVANKYRLSPFVSVESQNQKIKRMEKSKRKFDEPLEEGELVDDDDDEEPEVKNSQSTRNVMERRNSSEHAHPEEDYLMTYALVGSDRVENSGGENTPTHSDLGIRPSSRLSMEERRPPEYTKEKGGLVKDGSRTLPPKKRKASSEEMTLQIEKKIHSNDPKVLLNNLPLNSILDYIHGAEEGGDGNKSSEAGSSQAEVKE